MVSEPDRSGRNRGGGIVIDKKFEPYDITWWLVLVALLVSVSVIKAYASEDDDCRQAHHQCGHDDGDIRRIDGAVGALAAE